MPLFFTWMYLIFHLFMQLFWLLTSRGKNIDSFITTWAKPQLIPIALFEIASFVQMLFISQFAFPLFPQTYLFLSFIGLVVSFLGLMFAVWAKQIMGNNWGASAQHDAKNQQTLVTHGPFIYSRNPIYVGLFLFFVGQQIALQSYGIFASILFAVSIVQAVKKEEMLLTKYFGKTYEAYTQKVPRFL